MHTEDTTREEWRPVPGYEGLYSVSDMGRVRSEEKRLRIHGGHTRVAKARILKASTDRHGRRAVFLTADGVGTNWRVHRLVLLAFVGLAPGGTVCCHEDGNASNNRLENLRWDTQRANVHEAAHHGVMAKKLTRQDVWSIRESSASILSLADDYGISKVQVRNIQKRKQWAWLPDRSP